MADDDEMDKMISKFSESIDDNEQEVSKVREATSLEKVQDSICSLLSDQIKKATEYDKLIQQAMGELTDRLQNHELSFEQLMELLTTLTNKKLDLVNTVLDPFKSQKNGLSLIVNNGEKSDVDVGLKDLSPKQMQQFDEVYRLLNDKSNHDKDL